MTGNAPRWRSRTVNLVLLGTAGSLLTLLGGCSSASGTYSSDYHRNVYASAEDCAQDYSAATCSTKGESRGNRFLGPAFRMAGGRPSPCAGSDPGPGRAVASPRTGIERGGFGPSCSRRGFGTSSGRSWGG